MKIVYDPVFITMLKKLNVRIRKSFKHKILLFSRDPHNPELDNHALKGEYHGFWSIDITSDIRAIYEEIYESDEVYAYFVAIGTHAFLYQNGK